jgi:hypothetical protein
MERKFEFKPEIKAMAIEALSKLSFSQVHAVMNLLKREGNIYTESESNAIVGFIGEMAYRDVAHIFEAMPKMVNEVKSETDGPIATKTESPIAETVS